MKRLDDADLQKRVHGLYEYRQAEVIKLPPAKRAQSWDEIVQGYSAKEARVEALRCMQCQDPPCVKACPAHLDVPGYCQAIVDGDLKRGLKIILEAFPIPGTCGRICYHPCTDVCLKGVQGTPIEIPRLRRYIADHVDQRRCDLEIPAPTGLKVAVIGSGPAGLSGAYHLRRKGHSVVIFEKEPKPGGTLNTIPDYRLPEEILQGEIDLLRTLGIEIRLGTPIAGDGCLDRLLGEFAAVFISIGAVRPRKIETPGAELQGVYHGYDFLKRWDAGEKNLLGRRVAIVGGGDVALDSLRTAIRVCDEVYLLYRRSPAEMPAGREEVFELTEEVLQEEWHRLALELMTTRRKERIRQLFNRLEWLTMERMAQIEQQVAREIKVETFAKLDKKIGNMTIRFMTHPIRVLGDESGRVCGLELVQMELGEPDKSGRREPVPIKNSEFTLDIDTVLFSIGQEIDLRWLGEDHGLKIDKGNRLAINDEYETSKAWIFAGGDARRGPASMIEALADGRFAAKAIDRKLRTRGKKPL